MSERTQPTLPRRRRTAVMRFALLSSIMALSAAGVLAESREARAEESPAIAPHLNAEQRAERAAFYALRRQLPHGIPSLARTRALVQAEALEQTPAALAVADPITPSNSQWTFIGPQPITNGQGLSAIGFCVPLPPPPRIDVSGRVTALAFGASTSTIYLGAADGGVWKSTDGGANWTVLTDQQPSIAVGSVAVVPGGTSTQDVVYVGTGEANTSGDSEYGQGVLKSADGGASWTQLAEATFDRLTIGKLAVVPGATTAQDVLYAATNFGLTTGTAADSSFVTTKNAGLFKSTDGGASWTLLSGTGGLPEAGFDPGPATDVVIDPTNAATVYVAIQGTGTCNNPTATQCCSNADCVAVGATTCGGTGPALGGIWKTTTSGATWTQLGGGFPSCARRIALSISPDGTALYAARAPTATTFDAVYQSTNRGANWTKGGALPAVGGAGCLVEQQESYDLTVQGDSTSNAHFQSTVYLGLVGLYKSTNGGADFSYVGTGTHSDYHTITINSAGVFAGNDGGITKSTDGGATWDNSLNATLGITQFYALALSPATGSVISGGTQDNGTNEFDLSGSTLAWSHSDDGDGSFTVIDQQTPTIFFDQTNSSTTALSLSRSSTSGTLGSYVSIPPPAGDPVQFFAPYSQDPNDGERLLFGTNRIWESCSVGPLSCNGATGWPPTWTAISGDLTGGCTTSFCDLTDIRVAPTNSDVLYACTSSDGRTGPKVWVSLNSRAAAPTFTDITPRLRAGVPITSIAVSPASAATVLVSVSGFSGGGQHVFRSTDSGGTWSDISGEGTGFPDIPANKVIFDQTNPATTYYVGTDIGVFRTTNAGTTWSNFNTGTLPVVPVYDLQMNSSIIGAATHGRGVWAISLAVGTSTTTAISTTTTSSTTTTLPCTSARCILGAALMSPACAGQSIPASVTRKLNTAETLIDQASARPAKKARRVRHRARRLLRKAGATATRAAKGKKGKLSALCAADLKDAAGRVAAGL